MPDPEQPASFRRTVVDALATTGLRRLQASWALSSFGQWAFSVILAVYAYDLGGATAVGLAALVRLVPAGLAAPFWGVLVDRSSRRDVLLATDVARALALHGRDRRRRGGPPLGVVLVLSAVFTVLQTAHIPAQAALLPALAVTPRQLAAANALTSSIENAGVFVGSLIGGALVAAASAETAFAAHRGAVRRGGLAARPVFRVTRCRPTASGATRTRRSRSSCRGCALSAASRACGSWSAWCAPGTSSRAPPTC